MGHATHAANILSALTETSPDIAHPALVLAAIRKLTVNDAPGAPSEGVPTVHRDGFVFQVISWAAAQQEHGGSVLIRDPHSSATAQGIDGLMLELSEDRSTIHLTTIFEDKCTEHQRRTFMREVLPTFSAFHQNLRSPDLVATASGLLRWAGIPATAVPLMAATVLDPQARRYRAAFAIEPDFDSQQRRATLFANYDNLQGLTAIQRVGATLVVSTPLRAWFATLAATACEYLRSLPEGSPRGV